MMKRRAWQAVFGIGVLAQSWQVFAAPEYTYVKASLGFPWFMFFVFLSLVLIPFLLIIVLSWQKTQNDDA